MTYSSKIMILMMGLSKNLKSHTPLSWPNITRVPISHTSVSLIDRYNQEKWICDLAERTGFGRRWFSSNPAGRGYCPWLLVGFGSKQAIWTGRCPWACELKIEVGSTKNIAWFSLKKKTPIFKNLKISGKKSRFFEKINNFEIFEKK